ncbi:MAG: hypothetical protein ABI833_18415 [Acidobacteriota bacterium]
MIPKTELTLKTQQRIARALAAWCLVFLVVLAGRPSFTNASLPVRGVADPVVALQIARNADEVEAVLADAPSADREVMRVKQYVDFALIAGYLALAFLISAALFSTRRLLALTIGGVGLLAAVADVLENLDTLRIVNLNLSQLTPAMLNALRFTSFTKWILLAGAVALLAAVTLARKQWYLRAAGFLGLAGAILTVAGLFYNSILVWGGLLMFLALLLTAVTLRELTYESAS